MSDELREIFELGEEVHAFLNSRVGQYIIEKAKHHRNKTIDGIRKADPEDVKKMARLQRELNLYSTVPQWLNEALLSAEQGLTLLKNEGNY